MMNISELATDVLIIGSGGAGLFAALHVKQNNPEATVAIAVKGLLGKCGCTRMVQGGYNVALSEGDSVERHFMDTILGGHWIPNQELVWHLVNGAVERVRELENEVGCFFDRNADGSLHGKAFAGQTWDRTIHKADLTGIEIINRLMEQVRGLNGVSELEEYRAIALIPARDKSRISGALFVNMRTGRYVLVRARAVLLAAGGGPTMYRYHTPSGDKTCDGIAMAARYGLHLRDMEMVQFHPTGLLGGLDTRMTGTVLEEGLRGAGGYLLNGNKERFMHNYDPERGERSTRDVVSRGIYSEMRAGRVSPMGGVYIQMKHLGEDKVRQMFPGMTKRCADCGFDLAGGLVEVVPTAHFMMGGVVFNTDCSTEVPGLYAAGEDTGGVHGANRLGGNGVAESTVFGGIAGYSIAKDLRLYSNLPEPDNTIIDETIAWAEYPFHKPARNFHLIRDALSTTMWEKVGIIRNKDDMFEALEEISNYRDELMQSGLVDDDRRYNVSWHDWMNLRNLIDVSEIITHCALERENSAGAHYRSDFPEEGDHKDSYYVEAKLNDTEVQAIRRKVDFTRVGPDESILS